MFPMHIPITLMNYLWEAWLDVFTDTKSEAIVSQVQSKQLNDYEQLMCQAIREIHRVLKPGRWLSLMFHNSSAAVWSVLQRAISDSGFIIVKTRVHDADDRQRDNGQRSRS
jgi:adenine-specific DNA methylase